MPGSPLILTLDMYGTPHRWVSWQMACVYQAKELVAWEAGDRNFSFQGGTSRITGERSHIETNSIIAINNNLINSDFGFEININPKFHHTSVERIWLRNNFGRSV